MFLGLFRVGTRLLWSITNDAGKTDLYPARVYEAAGRQVALIVLRKNLAGEEYHDLVRTGDRFVDAREGDIIEGFDDVPMSELAQKVIADKEAHAAARTADATV